MGIFDGILDFIGGGDDGGGILGSVLPAIGSWFGGPAGGVIGSIGSALIGGRSSRESVEDTNALNLQLAREGQAFNAEQAQKMMDFQAGQVSQKMVYDQHMAERAMAVGSREALWNREWQERMSNTAYQRAKVDLDAAGMNPMLALMKGPASTPHGGQGSGVSGSAGVGSGHAAEAIVPQMQNAKLVALNTAMQAATFQANLRKIFAETKEIESRAAVNAATVPRVEQETKTSASSAAELDARRQKILTELRDLLPAEIDRVVAHKALMSIEYNWTWERLEHEMEKENLTKEEIKQVKAATEAIRLHLPELRNKARAQESWWMQEVSPYIPDAVKSIFSGSMLERAMRRR